MIPYAVRQRAASIRLLVLDVDGVLTDGSLTYGPEGESTKTFHVRDGLGIRLLGHEGIDVAVLSARKSPALLARCRDLWIPHVLAGRDDKLRALRELLEATGIAAERVAHVGDDILDLPVMRHVGLGIAVRDAHPLVLAEAAWITDLPGGRGAVREIADGLLDARGRLRIASESLLEHAVGKDDLTKA